MKENPSLPDFKYGEPYTVEYYYKGNIYKDTGTYQGFKVGYHYFRCDGMGDWMVLKPKNILSATCCTNKNLISGT